MREYYKMFFENLVASYPDTYQNRINEYINNLRKVAMKQPKIMFVAIFSYIKNDENYLKNDYPELYANSANYNKWTEEDKKSLIDSFINIVAEIGEEVMVNAI